MINIASIRKQYTLAIMTGMGVFVLALFVLWMLFARNYAVGVLKHEFSKLIYALNSAGYDIAYDDIDFIKPDGSFNLTTNPIYFAKVFKEKYALEDVFVTKDCLQITNNAYIYPYTYFCTDNVKAYAVHHYSGSWKPDWNVRNKFSLSLGKKKSLVLRKYKKNRDGSEMPFDGNEKILFSLKTSKRSKWFLLIVNKQEEKC